MSAKMNATLKTVTSRDGTTIAFDQSGEEPAIVLVDGALQYRAFDQGMAQLAGLLAQRFTVFHYDRRGRGDSTDTPPYALEREIEDILCTKRQLRLLMLSPVHGATLWTVRRTRSPRKHSLLCW